MACGGVGRFPIRQDPLVSRLVQLDLHKALKGIFPKASSEFLMNEVSTAYQELTVRPNPMNESEMLETLTKALLTKNIPEEDISQLTAFADPNFSPPQPSLGRGHLPNDIVPDSLDVIEGHLRNDLLQSLMKIFPKAHRGFLMANIDTVIQNLGPSEDRKLETLICKIVEFTSVPKDSNLGLRIFDTSEAVENEILSYAPSLTVSLMGIDFASKAASADFECGCCFSSASSSLKVTCARNHGFCRDCVRRYVNHIISGEGSSSFACLTDGCQAPFLSAQLQFLDPNHLKRLEERQQSEEVIKALADCDDGQIFQCPFCDFKCLIPESNKVLECLNPKCAKESCKLCKENWDKHFGLPCDQVEAEDESDLRVRTEEAMTNVVVRRCIKCNAPFVKEAGCNKMTCRCGSMQCYICRQPVRSYEEHFCQHVTEGQECKECTKCLLFEDVQRVDEARVEMKRQQGAECLFEQGYSAKGNTIFNSMKAPSGKTTVATGKTVPKHLYSAHSPKDQRHPATHNEKGAKGYHPYKKPNRLQSSRQQGDGCNQYQQEGRQQGSRQHDDGQQGGYQQGFHQDQRPSTSAGPSTSNNAYHHYDDYHYDYYDDYHDDYTDEWDEED